MVVGEEKAWIRQYYVLIAFMITGETPVDVTLDFSTYVPLRFVSLCLSPAKNMLLLTFLLTLL